jgi:hypothetical protein
MNKKEKQIFTGLFLALGFLIALGIAGNGDLEEAETQARVYTEMVCAGHWPDYENRNPDCGG